MAVSPSSCLELSPSFWARACEANPHGLGMMWFEGRRVRHRTTLDYDPATIKRWLREIPVGTRMAIHLREATSGSRCALNVHPHVHEESSLAVALMHNGSLPFLQASEAEGLSDSALLLQSWLVPRLTASSQPYRGFNDRWKESLRELRSLWPARNRLVLLNHLGQWESLAKKKGFRLGGTWVSNPKAKAWV